LPRESIISLAVTRVIRLDMSCSPKCLEN
jgi:hypothetical protein